MTIFDQHKPLKINARGRHRLNIRHRFCVEEMKPYFTGRRVLDLASHDGRWAYSYAEAGASEVIGVEPRQDLVEGFSETFLDDDARARTNLVIDDAGRFMQWCVDAGERFDFIAILGFYYHTMEHFRLLDLARQLQADTIVIDSEFIMTDNPVIQLAQEATDKVSNAAASYPGQDSNVIGIPSTGALERMADVLGYDVYWSHWDGLEDTEREGLGDYFRNHRKRRQTCRLAHRSA